MAANGGSACCAYTYLQQLGSGPIHAAVPANAPPLSLPACVPRYLTSSIEEFSNKSGLGKAFVATIILPIAGNACEHLTVGVWGGGRQPAMPPHARVIQCNPGRHQI